MNRTALAMLSIASLVVAACDNGESSLDFDISGDWHIDVALTASTMPPVDRRRWLRGAKHDAVSCRIESNGSWTMVRRLGGKEYRLGGPWSAEDGGWVFVHKDVKGKKTAFQVSLTGDSRYLRWNEGDRMTVLARGTIAEGARYAVSADADAQSPVKITSVLDDLGRIDAGKTALHEVLEKYRSQTVRWAGMVEGKGGADVRIAVGPLQVEVAKDTPGFDGLHNGSIVRVEGKIVTLNRSPWVYLKDAKVLSVQAAPHR